MCTARPQRSDVNCHEPPAGTAPRGQPPCAARNAPSASTCSSQCCSSLPEPGRALPCQAGPARAPCTRRGAGTVQAPPGLGPLHGHGAREAVPRAQRRAPVAWTPWKAGRAVSHAPPPPSLPYELDTSRPSSRTDRTRLGPSLTRDGARGPRLGPGAGALGDGAGAACRARGPGSSRALERSAPLERSDLSCERPALGPLSPLAGHASLRPRAPPPTCAHARQRSACAALTVGGLPAAPPPPPLPRTNRTSLVPPLVLSGHAAALTVGGLPAAPRLAAAAMDHVHMLSSPPAAAGSAHAGTAARGIAVG